jgi:subtilase family serine protease
VTNPFHNIAISDVTPSNSSVIAGSPLPIDVTVENQGNFTETFAVTLYATKAGSSDDILVGTEPIYSMPRSTSETLTFYWDTREVTPGNYTLRAEASVDLREIDTTDNVFACEKTMFVVPPPSFGSSRVSGGGGSSTPRVR